MLKVTHPLLGVSRTNKTCWLFFPLHPMFVVKWCYRWWCWEDDDLPTERLYHSRTPLWLCPWDCIFAWMHFCADNAKDVLSVTVFEVQSRTERATKKCTTQLITTQQSWAVVIIETTAKYISCQRTTARRRLPVLEALGVTQPPPPAVVVVAATTLVHLEYYINCCYCT